MLGVSPDPVELLAEFKAKEDLPFTLLSDERHQVAEEYGVWIEKSREGRTYWGNERTTFLIGPDGRIEKIFRKVDPKTHSELILSALTG